MTTDSHKLSDGQELAGVSGYLQSPSVGNDSSRERGKLFSTILIDPPWPYRWTGDSTTPRAISYPTMGMLEIAELPVSRLAASAAHVYLWITADFNRRGEASRLIQWWGFEYVGEIVWAKPGLGMGRFPRITHEFLCIGRRGKLPFKLLNVHSVQKWNCSGRHSEKPEAAVDLIEQNSPGPYLEMFARRQRLGWSTWGNECFENVSIHTGAVAPADSGDNVRTQVRREP